MGKENKKIDADTLEVKETVVTTKLVTKEDLLNKRFDTDRSISQLEDLLQFHQEVLLEIDSQLALLK